MNLSVVTAVRDDPLLARAIESVPLEVEHVVAMTVPRPETIRVAEGYRARRPRMHLVPVDVVGMAAGVNAGVRAASHERIVLLDSDCTLEPGTLGAFASALDRGPFVRGVTRVHRGPGWARFSGLGQEELNRVFARRARLIGPSIAFHKAPFLMLGGYDERSGASCDHEFALRLEERGINTAFTADAVVWHQAITLRIDIRSHLGYGRSMRYIDSRRGGSYGLEVCLMRWYPTVLWHKVRTRGVASVFRSLLLGGVMLAGYSEERCLHQLERS